MLAPGGTPIARPFVSARRNVSGSEEPSVVAAIAVNVSFMPTVMFVGDEKGNVSEGGVAVGVLLIITVTMKLVASCSWPLVSVTWTAMLSVLGTCDPVGVQGNNAVFGGLLLVILAPLAAHERLLQ